MATVCFQMMVINFFFLQIQCPKITESEGVRNPGAWQAIVKGIAKSQTRLSD